MLLFNEAWICDRKNGFNVVLLGSSSGRLPMFRCITPLEGKPLTLTLTDFVNRSVVSKPSYKLMSCEIPHSWGGRILRPWKTLKKVDQQRFWNLKDVGGEQRNIKTVVFKKAFQKNLEICEKTGKRQKNIKKAHKNCQSLKFPEIQLQEGTVCKKLQILRDRSDDWLRGPVEPGKWVFISDSWIFCASRNGLFRFIWFYVSNDLRLGQHGGLKQTNYVRLFNKRLPERKYQRKLSSVLI